MGAGRESWASVLGHHIISIMNENGQRLLLVSQPVCDNYLFQNKVAVLTLHTAEGPPPADQQVCLCLQGMWVDYQYEKKTNVMGQAVPTLPSITLTTKC